jgi:hypothetical protein
VNLAREIEELAIARLLDHKQARKLDRKMQRGNVTHRFSANGDRHRGAIQAVAIGTHPAADEIGETNTDQTERSS